MSCLLRVLCLLVVVLAATAAPASAQSALDRAERAFADVDLEGTRDGARAALDGGGLRREEVVRAYRLLGLSLAALGENRDAYEAFVRMLALDPEASLERSIAPQLRGPYLEARGYWSGRRGERFAVELVSGPAAIVVRVRDPLGLARTVRARGRVSTERDYETREEPARDELAVTFTDYEGYAQVAMTVLDEHGNVLAQEGTDAVPVELGTRRERMPRRETPSRTPRVLGGVSLGLAAASLALGAAFHVRRQSLADEWNGETCERATGTTRRAQCGDVRDDLDRAQTRSVVGYVLSGVFSTLGLVLFATSGGDEDAPSATVVACGVSATGVRCDGRF
ncbi:MAG: hypothetical protein R3B99_35035 [Polyangiales bacterium]